MGRIRILSDEVANKIAAGEVVERPASVIKELLENSLDAGASDLRVEAAGGGRRLLRVTDDGCGMLRDDAMLAFERHATSKLAGVKDLLSIATLGFRGEALPSIGSVSRLVLETRAGEEQTGTRVEVAGGKMLRCEEAGLPRGTRITVQDLFYNVPARKKFLRSDETELAHIASLVTHYSLAHPEKTFLLTHEGKELLSVTPAGRLRDRVYQVFGSQVLEELVELGVRERELELPPVAGVRRDEESGDRKVKFRLSGFISRPQVHKLNRNSIFLFVNRRLIRDRLLLHAISSAYHNLMPPACFPFALLFLECPCEEVDVNVHPSKTEVRFRHQSVVHDFVRDALREVLVESRPVSAIPRSASPQPLPPARVPQPGAGLPFSEFSQRIENQDWAPSEIPAEAPAAGPLPEFTLHRPPPPSPRLDFSGEAILVDKPAAGAPSALRLPVPSTHGTFPVETALEPGQSLSELADLRPLGQICDSFIIAAGRDGLWIIDQHVAHERILFERVLKQRTAGCVESQRLLVPLIVQLTASQEIEYARIAGELSAVGFETEPFGRRTLAVKAAPAGIGAGDIDDLIHEVLETADRELRQTSVDDLRRAIAASVACHAAIKINTHLEAGKIEWLLKSLADTECPMSCPHGRPIALRYSLRDILKGFQRI